MKRTIISVLSILLATAAIAPAAWAHPDDIHPDDEHSMAEVWQVNHDLRDD